MPLFVPARTAIGSVARLATKSFRGRARLKPAPMAQRTIDAFLVKRPRLSGPQQAARDVSTAATAAKQPAGGAAPAASSPAAGQPAPAAKQPVFAAGSPQDNSAPEHPEAAAPDGMAASSVITVVEQQARYQRLRAHANRNMALAKQVVIGCERGGKLPALGDLLVEESWRGLLQDQFGQPYFRNLEGFVQEEWAGPKMVFPPKDSIFRAFNSCPVDEVRVVILGQDPYHDIGQAMGLSFSVPNDKAIPSSLRNIYKELREDCGCSMPKHGNLEKWAQQGVLLLNAVLTVRAHQAGSHAKKGWERFTEAAISKLSQRRQGLVFLLWGRFAQDKTRVICPNKHHILTAAHPSGLSANRGFFGCRHFSKANALLEEEGLAPIDWQIE